MLGIGKALVDNKSGLEKAKLKVLDTWTSKINYEDVRSITVCFGVDKIIKMVEMVSIMPR